MSKKQYIITILLLITTLSIHLLISAEDLTLHIIFRFFYLIPIAYVGLKTGRRGGFLIAFVATILYAPHFLIGKDSEVFQAGNIVAVTLFYIAGIISGYYRKASQKVYLAHQSESVGKSPATTAKRVLFYADDKPLSRYTSDWFLHFFGKLDLDITILWISMKHLAPNESQESSNSINYNTGSREKLEELRSGLIQAGYHEDQVHTREIQLQEKARLANVIQEELITGNYDFVLIPKYKMSRSQEFLFGDTAIQLIRESGFPVLSVACDSLE